MATNELREVRRSLGKLLRIHTQVTTTSAGNAGKTTFVATGLSDYFPAAADIIGLYAHNQVAGEWRRVTAYNTTTFTATVNRAFTAQVNSSVVIDLYAVWDVTRLDQALGEACSETYPDLMNTLIDESLTTIAETYEYTQPAAILDLHREWGAKVWYKTASSIATFPYEEVHGWSVRDDEGVRKIVIPGILPASRTIRLRGFAPYTVPSTDTATFPLTDHQIRMLLYKAAAILYLGESNENAQDRNFTREQAQLFEAKYQHAAVTIPTLLDPGTIRSPGADARRRSGDIAEYADPV